MNPRRNIAFLISAASIAIASCSSAGNGAFSEAEPATDSVVTPGGSGAATTAPTFDGERLDPTEGNEDDLFDQDRLHTFNLDVSADALAELDSDPTAEEFVDATLSFQGQEFGAVGLRYKGSVGSFVGCTTGTDTLNPSGAKTCTKLSMKVKVNWNGSEDTFFGVKRLQFHSQNLDSSALHERLGYWLFRESGVPAPRSTHARVVVNGEYVGLFALTEHVDGRFTRDNFDDGTGNLYKQVWPFTSDGDVRSVDSLLEGLKTNEKDDPSVELIQRFAQAIADAPEGTERAVLDTFTDTEALVKYAVIDRAIRHDDGPFHWYCSDSGCGNQNYYWYEEPTANTVHLVPWDLDGAFANLTAPDPYTAVADGWNEVTNDCGIFAHAELDRLQRSAACDPFFAALGTLDAEYQAARADFLAGPFSAELVNAQLDAWAAQIEPALAEAAATHDDALSLDEWRRSVDELKVALETSRAGGAGE